MPNSVLILWPAAALVALTFLMLGAILVARVSAARRGEVRPKDFALGESERVPASVKLVNRNYMSLLELPILFYVLIILLMVTNTASDLQLMLAWAFVILRVVHSLVHVTVNHIFIRLIAFAGSVSVLIVMWILFCVRLM